jgi:hypothetical protein
MPAVTRNLEQLNTNSMAMLYLYFKIALKRNFTKYLYLSDLSVPVSTQLYRNSTLIFSRDKLGYGCVNFGGQRWEDVEKTSICCRSV